MANEKKQTKKTNKRNTTPESRRFRALFFFSFLFFSFLFFSFLLFSPVATASDDNNNTLRRNNNGRSWGTVRQLIRHKICPFNSSFFVCLFTKKKEKDSSSSLPILGHTFQSQFFLFSTRSVVLIDSLMGIWLMNKKIPNLSIHFNHWPAINFAKEKRPSFLSTWCFQSIDHTVIDTSEEFPK